jgi:ElaB/YqjD/DUF883 family membrane-anchored ribosome-binding protein
MTSDNDYANTFSGGPTKLNGGEDLAEQAARAAQEARRTMAQGAAQARELAEKAQAGQPAEQLNQAIATAGQQLQGVARQVRQLAPEGQTGEVAGRAADLLERGGSYLQSADTDTIRTDLEQLIRRYPLQALAVGLGIGFLLGRGRK